MNKIIKNSILSLGVASLLIACGGSSGGKEPVVKDTTEIKKVDSISGKAVDGYLMGSTVCLDLNLNGFCDNDIGTTNVEPFTLTSNDGASIPNKTIDPYNYIR